MAGGLASELLDSMLQAQDAGIILEPCKVLVPSATVSEGIMLFNHERYTLHRRQST